MIAIDIPELEDLHWLYELHLTLVRTFWVVPVIIAAVLLLTA